MVSGRLLGLCLDRWWGGAGGLLGGQKGRPAPGLSPRRKASTQSLPCSASQSCCYSLPHEVPTVIGSSECEAQGCRWWGPGLTSFQAVREGGGQRLREEAGGSVLESPALAWPVCPPFPVPSQRLGRGNPAVWPPAGPHPRGAAPPRLLRGQPCQPAFFSYPWEVPSAASIREITQRDHTALRSPRRMVMGLQRPSPFRVGPPAVLPQLLRHSRLLQEPWGCRGRAPGRRAGPQG